MKNYNLLKTSFFNITLTKKKKKNLKKLSFAAGIGREKKRYQGKVYFPWLVVEATRPISQISNWALDFFLIF